MSKTTASSHDFMLTLFDRAQWCPVLQTRFKVENLNQLRSLLGVEGDDDANLDRIYHLDDTEAACLAEMFCIEFDWAVPDFPDREFIVDRIRPNQQQAPYLVHTGYELPLLLDGRKKLARFMEPYPPQSFEGEDRFDLWVTAGQLHKDVEIEPFRNGPHRLGWQGTRTIYYTPKGEEWRIPAMKLLWDAASWPGWNEHFERIEGMLFGYEDWQNNWWIESTVNRGGFGGLRLWCAVDEAGLTWIEAAGHRALAPINQPLLVIDNYDADLPDTGRLTLCRDAGASAMAVFSVRGNGALDLFKGLEGPPWHLPAARIPQLNTLLLRSVTIKQV